MNNMIDVFLENAKQAVVRGKVTLNASVDFSPVSMVNENPSNVQNNVSGYSTGTDLPAAWE